MSLSLADLGIAPEEDAGCTWHPRADKTEARDADGNLCDLDDDQVTEHINKPEAEETVDGWVHRKRAGFETLAAEDSDHSEPGEV